MEEKVLAIINLIREHKGMESLNEISINCLLRDDLGFTSFDLAELSIATPSLRQPAASLPARRKARRLSVPSPANPSPLPT